MSALLEFDAPAPMTGFERLAGAVAHGSLLLGVPVLLPLAIWILFPLLQPPSAYVRQQALQALVFHLVVSVIVGGLFGLAVMFGLVGILEAALRDGELPSTWLGALGALLVASLVTAWASIVELIATVKAFQGKPYGLPIVKGWLR